MNRRGELWTRQAAQWERIGPPLRPQAADLEVYRSALAPMRGGRTLLLGVTSEVAGLLRLDPTGLVAVDRCAEMIRRAGPADGAVRADWRELPFADAVCAAAVGDGCFIQLRHPDELFRALRSVHRVLRPGGLLVTRAFVRPDRSDSPAAVVADLDSGRIGSFHVLKFRLAMALQRDTLTGVQTGEVWEYWSSLGRTAADLGWPSGAVATIDAYRGQKTVYHFPTLDELGSQLAHAGFEEVRVERMDYEMGDRCPILILRRADR